METVGDSISNLGNRLLSTDLFNLFIPNRCPTCKCPVDIHSDPLCDGCKQEIVLNSGHSCAVCAESIEGDLPPEAKSRCGRCRISPPPFDRTLFSLRYTGKTRNLIHQFKFRGKAGLSIMISGLISARILRELELKKYDLIMPIPLHFIRLLARGYNQSYLLARDIARSFNMPVNSSALVKRLNTPPQSSLSKAKRLKSIENAFTVKDPEDIEGKNILLIDDLMTTGSTLIEASKTLKKYGAKSIACAVAARA